jgi:hypothetical protein
MPKAEPIFHLDYQMKYPGQEAYHFPSGPSHNSPCMDQYWRAQPIRQSEPREEETELDQDLIESIKELSTVKSELTFNAHLEK